MDRPKRKRKREQKSLSSQKRAALIFFMTAVAIPIVYFCVFWIGTNLNSFILAFQNKDGFTFEWFRLGFQEIFNAQSTLRQGVINTLIIFAVSNLFVFPLSILFSFFLYKKIFLHRFFRVVFFLPAIISAVVFVTLFTNIMNGPVAQLLRIVFRMADDPILIGSYRYSFRSILIYIIWVGLSSNMVIYCGTMSRIPQEVLESARMDGIGFFGELVHIVIPLIWPSLSVILLIAMVGVFNADGPVLLMTQGRFGTYTLSYWLYERTTGANSNLNYGAAVGLIFTMVSVPIAIISRFLINRIDTQVEF